MKSLIVSSTVVAPYDGLPVASYLARRFTYLSEEQWRGRIAEQRIRLNDEPATASQPVHTGDTVSYHMPDFTEPPADLRFSIVYEDRWLLGVNKPGNLLVHRSGRSFRSNLIYQLRYVHQPAYPHVHAVNRLDRGTSGVVVCALDTATLSAMHRLFAQRAVEKSYLALVHGLPAKPRGVIDAPIGATQRKGVYAVGGAGAKDAVTRYALDRHVGHAHALVRLWPHTGRTHQVRVHLAYLGTPIVGDALYGAVRCRDRATEDAFGGGTATRHALHCSAVRFRHPHTGTPCGMDAALPSDMKRLIAALEAGHEQDGRPVE